MTAVLLSWKEIILFAALIIFLFIPWSRGLRRYLLLGLFIYLLNKPLVGNFHAENIMWWLKKPAAWITVATWVGTGVISFRWLKGMQGQGVWNALSKIWWQPHFITFSLIILALFLFNLSKISPQFKTQADFSFVVILINVPLQYLIGFLLLRTHDEIIQSPPFCALTVVLFCVLVMSLVPLYGTITQYRALLSFSPSQEKTAELIGQWEALLERNKVPSFGSIRAAAYGRTGDLKFSLGDLDGALRWYKKALREDLDDVTGHIGLARILVRKGETEEAKETFQKVIRRTPSLSWEQLVNVFPPLRFPEIFLIAQALEAEGRQEEAFHAYKEARQMRPEDPGVNCGLGKIYFSHGEYNEALIAFQKTLDKLPRQLYALSYLGDIYEKVGNIDLAQKYRDIIMKNVVTHRILTSDWRGKQRGRLYGKGECHATIKLYKGRGRFQIYARGTPAQGVWPHMVIKLGKEVIGETDVTSREWKPYNFTKNVQTGEYTLWVYFTNDFYLVKEKKGTKIEEDRNLFVGAAEITYIK